MIDYEKLKLAHAFVSDLAKKDGIAILQVAHRRDRCNAYTLQHSGSSDDGDRFLSIDDLIAKLQKLTEPKPKYEIGQKLWFYRGDNNDVEVSDIKIMEIKKFADGFFYSNKHEWVIENHLYPSKQALIEAQIEYWTCLKNEEISTCSDDVSNASAFGRE